MERAMENSSCVGIRRLDAPTATFEFLLNALRLTEGFARELFSRTGQNDSLLEQKLSPFIDKKWIISEKHLLKPTAYGIRFLNEILLYCLPDATNN